MGYGYAEEFLEIEGNSSHMLGPFTPNCSLPTLHLDVTLPSGNFNVGGLIKFEIEPNSLDFHGLGDEEDED